MKYTITHHFSTNAVPKDITEYEGINIRTFLSIKDQQTEKLLCDLEVGDYIESASTNIRLYLLIRNNRRDEKYAVDRHEISQAPPAAKEDIQKLIDRHAPIKEIIEMIDFYML